ncbi:uncharacterized protein TNCV_1705011 [Trichonephila clavipes]|nr:uncharacterized protein TNCV_1705011 [Trichonephila clavipes]
MVFQERMLHGEPNKAKLEEILKNGKEYLPLAMHMTDENSVRWQTMYNYVKVVFPNTREILQGIEYKSLTAFRCNSFTLNASSRVIMWFKILLPHQHYPLAAMVGKDGKLYFRLLDVGALFGRYKVYKFAKRFDNIVIQGKDLLPAHKQYPIMTQKSKLVTPDVVFNILNAELSSLAMSFAISLNAGSALVENPSNLFVESYKTSPVLHVQDSPVPNSILVRLCVQTFIQKEQGMRRMQNGSKTSMQMVYEACLRAKATPSVAERLSLPEIPSEPERIPTPSAQRPERIPTPPVESERIPTPPVEPERPAEPLRMPPAEPQRMPPAEPEIPAEPERPPMEMVDPSFSVNTVEVTPPLITRCDKSTQTISPYLHVKRLDLGKRRMEQPQASKRLKQEPSEVSNNIVMWVPRNHPLMKLGNNGFIIQPTNVNGINK